jgi:hypothetical protein
MPDFEAIAPAIANKGSIDDDFILYSVIETWHNKNHKLYKKLFKQETCAKTSKKKKKVDTFLLCVQ